VAKAAGSDTFRAGFALGDEVRHVDVESEVGARVLDPLAGFCTSRARPCSLAIYAPGCRAPGH
jgi:hypothetical protein